MSSDEEYSIEYIQNEREHFLEILKENRIVLNRSMTSKFKEMKNDAWTKFHQRYTQKVGKYLPISKLKKKLNNMKTNIKKKTDKISAGDKRIKLTNWEKEFLDLMQHDEIPKSNKIPEAISADVFTRQSNSMKNKWQNINDSIPSTSKTLKTNKLSASSKAIFRITKETEKTKNLSTTKLQRLLLLEQLKAARLKIKKYDIELKLLKYEVKNYNQKNSNSEELFEFITPPNTESKK